ncbi:ATP-grasp fold amidoligase family protein [Saccharospirillum sp.]|uniref:ATP-grasp fold amidoligase family protein n=1 Tax=Saccharospirillum sp. TaxID=2033801 RepID=UPI0034A0896E
MKWTLRTWEEQLVAGLDRLLGFPRERKRFYKAHGYPLNLKEPTSFNEKICWKKIYDRDPLVPVIADKYRVRDYVREVLGEAEANSILIPLLAVADKPEDLDISVLPDQFVVKSNHGSGNNLLVFDKSKFDFQAFIKEANTWLKAPYGIRNHEWAYSHIDRKIMVEQLLLEQSGSIPSDYKFCMIHGECAFIKVDKSRFNNFTSTLYDSSWNKLKVDWRRPQDDYSPAPQQLEKMLEIARALSKKLDFIRVDYYVLGDHFYLGELTNYPVRGRGKFNPTEFDFEMGRRWVLPGANGGE